MASEEGTTANEAAQIADLGESTLLALIGSPKAQDAAVQAAEEGLPSGVATNLAELTGRPDSYRDALLVALAAPIVRNGPVDITQRTPGGRSASDKIGRLLRAHHIRGVVGAYQNIGKNSPTLVRGNNQAFDAVLSWGSAASVNEIRLAYGFVAAKVAATARVVSEKPLIRPAQLTFARVMRLITHLFDQPSGGAHEQYTLSALLEASAHQQGDNLRVETKALNASDASSKKAGDIEILQRGRLQESLEVSASPWTDKVDQAEAALKESGLQRAHIAAAMGGPADYETLSAATDKDISILDPAALAATLVALLDRRGREFALIRLYELLDEKLADPSLVNSYVAALKAAGLADPSEA